MEKNRVIISEDMRWLLEYADWSVDEVMAAIPTMFPNGKNIELVSASDDYLDWIVDGKEYTTDVEGKIVE